MGEGEICLEDAIKNYYIQYVSEYKILQKNKEGQFEISVIAPDFERIIESILTENKEVEITVTELERAIQKYSDYEKEYRFYSNSEQPIDIENAFLQKVSYELAVGAIKNIEYTEEWSTVE